MQGRVLSGKRVKRRPIRANKPLPMPWNNLVQIPMILPSLPSRVRVAASLPVPPGGAYPCLSTMDPEFHTTDQDVIVFNENELLEVRGLIQGAILNGN